MRGYIKKASGQKAYCLKELKILIQATVLRCGISEKTELNKIGIIPTTQDCCEEWESGTEPR